MGQSNSEHYHLFYLFCFVLVIVEEISMLDNMAWTYNSFYIPFNLSKSYIVSQ